MNKKAPPPGRRRFVRPVLVTMGILLVLLIAGYFVAGAVIRKKVDEALHTLPPSLKVTYTSLHPNLLGGSLVIDGLQMRYTPETDNRKSHDHEVSIARVVLGGIHFFTLLRSHRLILGSLRVEVVTATL